VAKPTLRVLHITDTHLFAQADGRLRGVDTYRTLSRVLDRAAGDARPPEAILVTGDLSQDESPGAYQQFRKALARLNVPVWCLPGNHDAPLVMGEALSAPPFSVGGAVVRANWCLILLNSYIRGDHGGRLAPDQLEWLDAMLRVHHGRHVLLAVHHHALPLKSRWLDALALYNAGELLAIIDRSPQVRCVVAGHVHQASDIDRNGVRFVTTPSTCFQFLPAVDSFGVDTRPPGFRWLDLMPDGTVKTEVVWVDPE
jgi:3',5'-cyclic-AMP phosphodiesterase